MPHIAMITNHSLVRWTLFNLVIGIVVGVSFWVLKGTAQGKLLTEINISLVHSSVYALSFGLFLSAAANRLTTLVFPLNWVSIVTLTACTAWLSTAAVQMILVGLSYQDAVSARSEYPFKSITVMLIASLIGIGIYAYESVVGRIAVAELNLRNEQLENERAQKLLVEARLAAYEAKLHPHFLFNTLNSISALTKSDPQLADEMVLRLATLLRSTLTACDRDAVPLSSEVDLVRDYLQIEKVRFEDRLECEFRVGSDVLQLLVPPLILLPLAENTVKHGLASRPEPIKFLLSAEIMPDNLLRLAVEDDGPRFSEASIRPGHGLATLRSRLDLLFDGAADLEIRPSDKGNSIELTLPIHVT
ncbi:MAG: histidine kinase [Acidobacteria bacterium]|nr:histidine kinase [Acidobacteriota bacterium]